MEEERIWKRSGANCTEKREKVIFKKSNAVIETEKSKPNQIMGGPNPYRPLYASKENPVN